MSDQPVLLTIAIPTFNRPGNVSKRLRELLPDLVEGVEIIVLDNHSDNEVAEELSHNFSAGLPVRVFRHGANLGAGANVLRCLEMAQSDWIWMLGDDDAVDKGALKILLDAIHEAEPTDGFIHFSTGIHTNPSVKTIHGIPELCELPLSGAFASNFLFLSASLYRRAAVLPFLRTGYMTIYSCCPHLALVLEMLRAGRHCMRIRTESVVAWECPTETQRWSNLKLLSGVTTLFEIDSLNGQALPIIQTIIKQGRWRPFVRQGFYYIFGDLSRPVRYWLALLSKLVIFGTPDMKLRSLLLLVSLPLAAVAPFRKWTAGLLGKSPMANSHAGVARM